MIPIDSIKEAKSVFMRTGRLNRNVIRDEVAISWYKCQLNKMRPKHTVEFIKSAFQLEAFTLSKRQLDGIVNEAYDYYLLDKQLKVLASRTELFHLNFTTFEEYTVGTNAGALSVRYEKVMVLQPEEHYLDILAGHFTSAFPIICNESVEGCLVLVSDFEPSPYDIGQFRSAVSSMPLLNKQVKTTNLVQDVFHSPLFHSKEQFAVVDEKVRSFLSASMPLLITGAKKTGKSTLAWHIFKHLGEWPYYLNLAQMPMVYLEDVFKELASTHRCMIIDHLELASEKLFGVITGVIDRQLMKTDEKHHIVFTRENIADALPSKLYERLKGQEIRLEDFDTLSSEGRVGALKFLLRQQGYTYDDAEILLVEEGFENYTYEEVIALVSALKEKCKPFTRDSITHYNAEVFAPLAHCEKRYIEEVYQKLHGNATLTCEVLNISRSTFYRKIDKHSK